MIWLLALALFANSPQPCVIAKIHAKTGADKWRWTVPRPFEYVEGDFPKGIQFRHELSDRQVREIKDKGGKFVVLPDTYSLEQLKDAREQCRQEK